MKQFWEQISQKGLLKKYRFALLILLLGVVLMLLPTSGKNEEVSRSDQEYETFSLEEIERRMEEILGRIEGTGKLQLMLTLKSGSQLQLAEDTDQTVDESEMSRRTETVTISRGSGTQEVIVTQQRYPVYQGALVVCQGAGQASVRLAVTEAISALTGLSSDKITVVQWNS